MGWLDRLAGVPRLTISDASDVAFRIAAWIVREDVSSRVIIHNAENILEWGFRDYARYKVVPEESRRILQQATAWASDYSDGFKTLAKMQRHAEAKTERLSRWRALNAAREEYFARTGSWPAEDIEFKSLYHEFGLPQDEQMISYGPEGPFRVSFPRKVKSDGKILALVRWEGA
jgi:hypothetical protein